MFKRNQLNAAIASALGFLQVWPSVSAAAEPQSLDRVEVTGSAIRRINSETALPVQVVGREEIARSGVTSTEELLQSVSALSSAGGTNNATGAGSSTYGLSAISLRGLGQARTLVLVNGRRLATFASGAAAVNINAIPVSAIERVEILKDGASAIYGSDAVAGVVNFIMTRNFTGLQLNANAGSPTRSGGGKTNGASLVGGIGELSKDKFTITATLNLEKESALFAKDRDFAKTGNVAPFLVAQATGQGNIEGAYTPGTGLPSTGETGVRQPGFGNSPGTGYGNPLALSGDCGDINMFDAGINSKGAPFCQFDSNAFVGLIPKRDNSSLTLNGAFDLSAQLQIYGDLLYSKSTVRQQFQPSPVRRSFLTSDSLFYERGVDPVLLIRPANPHYSIAADYLAAMELANPGKGFGSIIGQPLAVTARVFDFGDRTSEDKSTQMRIVAGAKGTLGSTDYDLALSLNKNKVGGTLPGGYFSQVAFASVVNRADSDYNPWSLTQSAEFNRRLSEANAKYTGSTLDATSKSTSLDGSISGELFEGPAGPAMYAGGIQARLESLKTEPSAALFSGDIAGLGGATLPVDADRKVGSVFGELNVPLTKELEAGAALRNDKYSLVGGSTTYKATVRFQPSEVILVRAGLGSGFRAPTLSDLFLPQTTGTSEQFTDPKTGQSGLQVPAVSGGNPDLKPERSRQRSAGIVVAPTKNFSFSVDAFQVRIDDILSQPSTQEIVSGFRRGDPAYSGLVELSPTGDIDSVKVIFANSGNAKVRGADIWAAFRQELPVGRLDLRFNGTYMDKFDQTSPGGTLSHKVGTIVDGNGDPVIGAENGGVVLRWKYKLSGTWTYGSVAATLSSNFTKGYEAGRRQVDGERSFIPDMYIYDANVEYKGIKNATLRVGVNNLFDKDPPIFVPVSNQFQSGFDITQYNPKARFVYVSGIYRFF